MLIDDIKEKKSTFLAFNFNSKEEILDENFDYHYGYAKNVDHTLILNTRRQKISDIFSAKKKYKKDDSKYKPEKKKKNLKLINPKDFNIINLSEE